MNAGPTNQDLHTLLWRVITERAEDRVLMTTLRDSHNQRVEKAAAAEEKRDRFETDMRTQAGATRLKVDQLTRDIAIIRPIVKKMRFRAILRRAVVQCFGRWWGLLTTLAVTIGGLFVWLGDHMDKVAALFKRWWP